MKRVLSTLAATVLVASTAACGGGDGGDGGTSGSDAASSSGGSRTLTVFAAASLTSTFEDLAEEFESQNDGVDVELSFAGSSDLVAQIQSGAPADVFASADEANMEKLTGDDLAGSDPEVFATNKLEIATPPDNPADVTDLQDLTKPGLNLVVCAPEVPCGAATAKVAEAAGITLQPVSEEQSVTDVLAKVTSGEADAGLVYVTDVIAAGDDVEGIELPEADEVVNRYPIATVAGSDEADLAQQWVDFVLGDEGRTVLTDAGFGQP